MSDLNSVLLEGTITEKTRNLYSGRNSFLLKSEQYECDEDGILKGIKIEVEVFPNKDFPNLNIRKYARVRVVGFLGNDPVRINKLCVFANHIEMMPPKDSNGLEQGEL